MFFFLLQQSLVIAWLLLNVIRDINMKQSRDWIHYFGLVVYLLASISEVASRVYLVYFVLPNI